MTADAGNSGDPGDAGTISTTLVLHWSLFAGLALFAIVALIVLWQGLLPAVFSPDRAVRSAAALIVGLGSFAGLKICRTALQPPSSTDETVTALFQHRRSVIGGAIIDGFGIAGICFGLLIGNARVTVILAGMALAAMFLARPDIGRLEATRRQAVD